MVLVAMVPLVSEANLGIAARTTYIVEILSNFAEMAADQLLGFVGSQFIRLRGRLELLAGGPKSRYTVIHTLRDPPKRAPTQVAA